MTVEHRWVAPPNLQFYVSDLDFPEPPRLGEKMLITTNGRALTIPCQYYWEGDTELVVGDYKEVLEPALPAFDGSIPTPMRTLVFYDIELVELLRFPVRSFNTRLRIWTDRLELPTRVVIGVE